jgi:hypothetical protein
LQLTLHLHVSKIFEGQLADFWSPAHENSSLVYIWCVFGFVFAMIAANIATEFLPGGCTGLALRGVDTASRNPQFLFYHRARLAARYNSRGPPNLILQVVCGDGLLEDRDLCYRGW